MHRIAYPLLLPAAFAAALAATGCRWETPTHTSLVTIVAEVDSLPAGSAVHITGNVEELGEWTPDRVHMQAGPDGRWKAVIRVPGGTRLEYKFTRGTWETEAVGPDGLEQPNFWLDVVGDTQVTHRLSGWRDQARRRVVVSSARMRNKAGVIELTDPWKFRPGHDTSWSAPGVDDSLWPEVRPGMSADDPPVPGWEGMGWFRLHLSVDSSLRGSSLALLMRQAGASEVYLNGTIVARFGTVGSSEADEVPFESLDPVVVVLGSREEQLLAVRYSCFSGRESLGGRSPLGFTMVLGETNPAVQYRLQTVRQVAIFQAAFATLALFIAFLHLMLFVFDRTERANLFFSLLNAALAILVYADFQRQLITSRAELFTLERWSAGAVALLIVAGLGTTYSFSGLKFPKHAYVLIGAAVGLLLWVLAGLTGDVNSAVSVLVLILALEFFRIVVSRKPHARGSDPVPQNRGRIIGAGALVFMVGTLYTLAAGLDLVPRFPFSIPPLYVGFLAFSLSVSAQLGLRAAQTRRAMERQLTQIGELSARALEQERRAHEEEVARRILEADNERKTKELEEARRMQLAMLPSVVPTIDGLDIAVHMETASEVGGDYYDFLVEDDGSIGIAIGDATGHGTRAGIMVTLIKSLFSTLGRSFYIPDFFSHCTLSIRRMNMEQLYMALLIVRIKKGRLVASSAGMPPFYVYRGTTGTVEEIVMKGMPLGAVPGFPYRQVSLDLHPGDSVLLLSDGFPERFNQSRETLDYGNVGRIFGEAGGRSPREIIEHLLAASAEWSGGAPLNDDMTFVVLRRTE